MQTDANSRELPKSAVAPVTAMVVDGNPLVRMGVTSMLEQTTRIRVIGEAGDAWGAIEAMPRLQPHVVLVELREPTHENLDAVSDLAQRSAVIVLTSCVELPVVLRAVRSGALGYLIHGQFDAVDLALSVQAAAEGQARMSPGAVDALVRIVRRHADPLPWPAAALDRLLSEREVEVMSLIARGASNAEIAEGLCIREKTVRNHVNHIYTKLGARTRAQAIARWLGTSAS